MYLIKISDDNGELCFTSQSEKHVFDAMKRHSDDPKDSLLEVVLPENSRIVAMVLPNGDVWHSNKESPINSAAFLQHLTGL